MINVILIILLVLTAVLCLSSILWHRRQGELCECPGDCEHCKIQCRSNVKYYGLTAQTMPVMTDAAKKRIQTEHRISKLLHKIRQGLDFLCYWLFNLCAIATLIHGLVRLIGKWFHL